MAYKQLHQPDQLGNKEDKREDHESQKCVAENFADDIAVQDAHDGIRQCSTPAEIAAQARRLDAVNVFPPTRLYARVTAGISG
jgi:hypothetical protein